jgi:hypothetical protein
VHAFFCQWFWSTQNRLVCLGVCWPEQAENPLSPPTLKFISKIWFTSLEKY